MYRLHGVAELRRRGDTKTHAHLEILIQQGLEPQGEAFYHSNMQWSYQHVANPGGLRQRPLYPRAGSASQVIVGRIIRNAAQNG